MSVRQLLTSDITRYHWAADATSELISSLGNDGDTAVALDTGHQWVKSGGVWWDRSAGAFMGQSPPSGLVTVTSFVGNSQAANTDVALWVPWTVPANFLKVGGVVRFHLGLDIDIVSSATARNLVFKLKLGTTVIWTVTFPVTVSTAGVNGGGVIEGALAVYGPLGASCVVRSQAYLVAKLPAAKQDLGSSPVAGVTVNSGVTNVLSLTVSESVNSVADIVRAETPHFMLFGM